MQSSPYGRRVSRRLAVLMAVLAGSLAACTGQAGEPTSPGAPTPTPVAAAPSSAPPTATTTAAPVGGRHADPDLEALLPETLGGVALTRESQRGTELSSRSEALEAFLSDLGRTLDDFSLASAYAASGGLEAEVGAWRIRGADPSRLMDGFERAVQAASTTPLTITASEVAGRAVTRIGAEGELTRGPLYAYVVGDVVVFVQTPHPDLADEAIGKLPAPSG